MESNPDNNKQNAVGRSKTVFVFEKAGGSVGVVSEIFAQSSSNDCEERLVFKGPVSFNARTREHLNSIIIPILDRILEFIGIPMKNYEISITNLGATASKGIGIEMTGFSADLPILLSLLSSSLQVPLRQNIACTGHVGSLDGDIVPVLDIPAKLEALISSPGISAFVHPDLKKDRSLEVLTPNEYQSAEESLLRHKGKIKISTIKNIHDAIQLFMTDESVVLGSLRAGFFHTIGAFMEMDDPVAKTTSLLACGNEKRFWDALEYLLLNQDIEKAHGLLKSYVDFHIGIQSYPERFGEKLFRLVISLPPATRKSDNLFPLLLMEQCIKLSQYANAADHNDVRRLYNTAFGEGFSVSVHQVDKSQTLYSAENGESYLFERLLAEISEENLASQVGRQIDEGRVSYTMESVTVKDSSEFNEAITSFYAHLFRHTGSPNGHINPAALRDEANALLEKAFDGKGGYNAALSEGRNGTKGGMRKVFDVMTEYLKQEREGKYINRIFKEIIDPREWDVKVKLMGTFMERIKPELPEDLRDLPAEKLASHWETILRNYVISREKVSDLLKRL